MFSSSLILGTLVFATGSLAQQACNGYAQLCSVPYNQVTTVVTHNSYANFASPAANQACSITTQLDDGIRGLKLSAVVPTNSTMSNPVTDIHLCHTSCSLLDAGTATDTLTTVASWLKANPNEVLTIMWNNPNNVAFQDSDFNAIYQAAGLTDYVYTQPTGNNTWPTLQQLISSGKRVVTFADLGTDSSSVSWLLPEFNYVFETPYDNRNESAFSSACVIDRPVNPSSPNSMMYVMNHFLYGTLTLGNLSVELPQKGTANITNAQSLLTQANACRSAFGRYPTFLEVDFYNLGNTLSIAAQLNNVTYSNSTQLKCNSAGSNGNSGQSSASELLVSTLTNLFLVFLGVYLLL
ncbi:PLC-like phosphodiesterase [Hesseltinella vesiculosa]|uniref:PLC-like phosphodiesterase n=1 Tax=Hesseltinella vesiculosa TaxID=101127 RepID=A0A1X2G847_9FUNG|nr:PLC-like phosphodiesterase [Hesseltinella vesiculosa]